VISNFCECSDKPSSDEPSNDDNAKDKITAAGAEFTIVVVLITLFMAFIIVLSIRKFLAECLEKAVSTTRQLQQRRNPYRRVHTSKEDYELETISYMDDGSDDHN